jgi:hypothetical protein
MSPMRSREKIGVTLLALVFVGVGAYACSGSSDFGPQPFIDDVPSSSTTAPPAPENQDANVQFPDAGSVGYDSDAAYAHTLCESTCSCDLGKKQYCVGQYTNLSFTTCEVPDAGPGVDSGGNAFRLGCNVMPDKCFAGGKPYCPCIIESLGTTPCNIVCEDLTTGGVELYCPVP